MSGVPPHIWFKHFDLKMIRDPIVEGLKSAYINADKFVTWPEEAEQIREHVERIAELMLLSHEEIDFYELEEEVIRKRELRERRKTHGIS